MKQLVGILFATFTASFQTFLQCFRKQKYVRKRIIERHGSDTDNVRLAPVG